MFGIKLFVILLLLRNCLARTDSTGPLKFSNEIMDDDNEHEDYEKNNGDTKLLIPGGSGGAGGVGGVGGAGGGIVQIFSWLGAPFQSSNSFIGRCLGVARRLKLIMPFLLFKMGVIMTTLAFLTIISLKGLTVGIILLILNAGGILGKAALYKHQQGHQGPNYIPWAPAPPATVHVHVHKDGVHHYNSDRQEHEEEHYHPTAFSDRISKSLNATQSVAERIELVKLYKRLGLDVNSVLKKNLLRPTL